MTENTIIEFPTPEEGVDYLTQVLRDGARRLLAQAVESEAATFLACHADQVTEDGHRRVVRHGHQPERVIQTGIGPVPVKKPRLRDRGGVEGEDPIQFTSKILPPYLRRSKALDELIPALYLRGISTGDMQGALSALLGAEAANLSPGAVRRLVSDWQAECDAWKKRDLTGKSYIYIWADGVYLRARLEDDKQCILVLIGVTPEGKKELIGFDDGYRESAQSWRELLLDLKDRGLKTPPKLAVGDGALGFWAALSEVSGTTRQQRCWVHKTANVLNKLPKSLQAKAKSDLKDIWMAETRVNAEAAFDLFIEKYGVKYEKAIQCLAKDRDALLAFYDFPAEHWKHLRTTNPIESSFATVRHRTKRSKNCLSRKTAMAMVFKLIMAAEKRWRGVDAKHLLPRIEQGATFNDGIERQISSAA